MNSFESNKNEKLYDIISYTSKQIAFVSCDLISYTSDRFICQFNKNFVNSILIIKIKINALEIINKTDYI